MGRQVVAQRRKPWEKSTLKNKSAPEGRQKPARPFRAGFCRPSGALKTWGYSRTQGLRRWATTCRPIRGCVPDAHRRLNDRTSVQLINLSCQLSTVFYEATDEHR